jgi:hypothetical protein
MRQLILLLLSVGVASSSAGWLASRYVAPTLSLGAVTSQMPLPEHGEVQGGIYLNDYFDLSFPLPEGWIEGDPGPDPSDAGYYVLRTLIPKSELNATVLIAAQDLFFARKPHGGNVAEMARDFHQAMSEVDGMVIDREPTEIKVEDRIFYRVDFSGVGLYRATFTTAIRCHAVSFNLTAASAEMLERVALSLNRLSAHGKKSAGFPLCIENYAVPDNLVQRVAPAPVGAMFVTIPVRIIVDTAGTVKHIHVIRASAEQRRNIEEALRQWKFKPYQVNGRAVEIETGLVFRFVPAST